MARDAARALFPVLGRQERRVVQVRGGGCVRGDVYGGGYEYDALHAIRVLICALCVLVCVCVCISVLDVVLNPSLVGECNSDKSGELKEEVHAVHTVQYLWCNDWEDVCCRCAIR